MIQTIGVAPITSPRSLIAGACGGSISVWEKLDAELLEEDDIDVEPRRGSVSSRGSMNGPVILLVIVLTYANWSPIFFQVSISLSLAF